MFITPPLRSVDYFLKSCLCQKNIVAMEGVKFLFFAKKDEP